MATTKKRFRKTGNNNLLIFLAFLIVLAVISMVLAYFLTDNEKKTIPDETEKSVVVPIEGTWVSNYNGTMLTIKGQQIILELPSVDKSGIIKGKIAIEKNIVTFVYNDEPCKGIDGRYQYSVDKKGELSFKLIKDNCPARRELMSASWFRL